MEFMQAKAAAEREAAAFDGMLKNWYKSYANPLSELWYVLLLRRAEPELTECLAREILSRILNDDLSDCMRIFSYRRGEAICSELAPDTADHI